jgi:GNAT superfamily N-acetyltransferase
VIVRRRTDEDLPSCVRALEAVHAADGYPSRWPEQPAEWLCPNGCAAAWVTAQAHEPDTVLGHVCVVRGVDDPVINALTGAAPGQLARVSRLFVAPAARGRGLGATLLTALSAWTSERGLRLMLDVVDDDASTAVALYERLGWRLVDRRPAHWLTPQGIRLPVRVYLAPDAHGC